MIQYARTKAFTLLEILVALLILAIIAVILVMGLRSVITTKDRIDDVSGRLSKMQIAMTLIANDMRQIVNRPIFDNNGNPSPAMQLYSGPDQALEFTRSGYINPQGAQLRGTLQRVVYRYYNENLQRGTWQVLDRAPSSKAQYQTIIPNVTSIQWKFLGPSKGTYGSWPTQNSAAGQAIPKAIELTVTIKNWGTLHRWFVVESFHKTVGEPPNEKK